jgi:hypothetical protein
VRLTENEKKARRSARKCLNWLKNHRLPFKLKTGTYGSINHGKPCSGCALTAMSYMTGGPIARKEVFEDKMTCDVDCVMIKRHVNEHFPVSNITNRVIELFDTEAQDPICDLIHPMSKLKAILRRIATTSSLDTPASCQPQECT